MQTFMNPGEQFLTEEWTYPSIVAACTPYGMRAVPVAMDQDGMSAAALRKVLAEWDSVTQRKRYVRIISVAAASASFVPIALMFCTPFLLVRTPLVR